MIYIFALNILKHAQKNTTKNEKKIFSQTKEKGEGEGLQNSNLMKVRNRNNEANMV
jgi:hypothetical protein